MRSVVSSCNQVAKKMGIKAGMPIFQVKKICPSVIFLLPNFNLYQLMSEKIEKILLDYTKSIQKISIDEWLLDFSKSDRFLNETEVAEFIKAKIFKTLGLESSIGIGSNFFNAKTASYYAKPFGVFIIDEHNFEAIVWKIPISKMYMVGKRKTAILESIGIKTIGKLATFENQNLLYSLLGKNFETLVGNAKNISQNKKEIKKHSITSEKTFLFEDKADYDDIVTILKTCFKTVHRKIIVNSQLTKTIILILKTPQASKRKQYGFESYTDSEDLLWSKLLEIFNENWNNKVLRGIGVSLDNVIDHFQYQDNQNLFSSSKKLSTIDKINRELGYKALWYARVSKK